MDAEISQTLTLTLSRHMYCDASVSQTNSIIDERKPVKN